MSFEAIAAPSTQHNNTVVTTTLAKVDCCDPTKERYCQEKNLCKNSSQIRQQAPTLVAKQNSI
jgi:hypothetical protein